VDRWDDNDDVCGCEELPGLISMVACRGGGELGMTLSSGGSIASCSHVLGNSPCASRASTCRVNGGMMRVVAPSTGASGEGPPGGAGKRACPFSASLLAMAASTG